jgi:hypothetical protein
MKRIAVLLPMALFIAFVSAANSQSLADIAKKEKERREEIKNVKVITEEETAKFRSQAPAEAAAPDQASAGTGSEKKEGDAANKSEAGKPESNEPVDLQGRPESYWRKAMADARQKVKDLTNESNVIILKIADLQNQFYKMDDGFRRETIQQDLKKAYSEQDQNKEKLDKAKADLQDLENEARKSGALPGWITAPPE